MRLTTDRINLLQGYGLTEYQARAYLALLEAPMASAGALARLCRVPRNRLYAVLEDLQALGLVDIYLGEKRQYRALPFSRYLEKRTANLREEIQEIESRREYIDSVLQPMDPEDDDVTSEVGVTRVIRGRRAVSEEVDKLLLSARETVTLILTSASASRFTDHLAELARHVETEGRGPEVTAYVPKEAFGNGASEKLERLFPGCTRLVPRERAGILVTVDDRELLHVHPIPDDSKLVAGNDFAVYTTNHAFVSDAVETRLMLDAVQPAQRAGASPE